MRFRRFITAVLALALLLSCIPAHAAYNKPYYIGVDISSQIVTVYRTEDDSVVRQMLCSTGKNDATPLGVFYMTYRPHTHERREWYYLKEYRCYVKYASRIVNHILFHSLEYKAKNNASVVKEDVEDFGKPASHGCVRLLEADARFIALNCGEGTLVKIYKSGDRHDDLREMLYIASYTNENGMTYEEFAGYPREEGELGRDSEGQEVSDLQARLKELGYYGGSVNGKYGVDVLKAVKKLQKDLGLNESGVTSPALQAVIFSDYAPVSTGNTLSEGSAGPVVERLQQALADLRLYEGPIDGIYDVDVTDAVEEFQRANWYKSTGKASPEVQRAILRQQEALKRIFPDPADVQIEKNDEKINLATVVSELKIIIRSKPSTESAEMGKVRNGDTVLVGDSNDEWTHVKTPDIEGYMRTKYLSFYSQQNPVITYASPSCGDTFQMGVTLADYAAGIKPFSQTFEEGESDSGNEVRYLTVDTGSDATTLKLREQPDAGAEVLDELDNGMQLRALSVGDEWTLVSSGEKLGYLSNAYLSFWTGPADALYATEEADDEDDELADEDEGPVYAQVVAENGKVNVYDAGSADANILGQLPADTKVRVLESSYADDWVLIELQGRQGYIPDDNLKFLADD